ncbi:MAG: DUF3288 family protein [Cyanobacterium sp. T60_A2020_053]|nr:DUF3288 family protein [Cyanobacterium sp. T60_A2020_053]
MDQQHPLAHIDRRILEQVSMGGKTDYNLAEVARLKIRYQNFPGARDIQRDLDSFLQQWEMREDELFGEVRRIHAEGKVYRKAKEDQEDWS